PYTEHRPFIRSSEVRISQASRVEFEESGPLLPGHVCRRKHEVWSLRCFPYSGHALERCLEPCGFRIFMYFQMNGQPRTEHVAHHTQIPNGLERAISMWGTWSFTSIFSDMCSRLGYSNRASFGAILGSRVRWYDI